MAKVGRFEAIYVFETEADRDSHLELCKGLGGCSGYRTGYVEDELPFHQRRLGLAMLKAFKRPNQSVVVEDFQIVADEHGYKSLASIKTYISGMCKEHVLRRLGPGSYCLTAEYRNDAAATVCPDVDLDASSDGHVAGLEQGKAHLDRRGDAR